MKVREVAGDLTPRLEKARDELADARTQMDVALQRRDALIVEADAAGMSQRAIARAAGVSNPHVVRILAAADGKAQQATPA